MIRSPLLVQTVNLETSGESVVLLVSEDEILFTIYALSVTYTDHYKSRKKGFFKEDIFSFGQ